MMTIFCGFLLCISSWFIIESRWRTYDPMILVDFQRSDMPILNMRQNMKLRKCHQDVLRADFYTGLRSIKTTITEKRHAF